MKSLLKSEGFQRFAAWLIASYLNFALRTSRWTLVNRAVIDGVVDDPAGAIFCFWHGRIAFSPTLGQYVKGRPRRALISRSKDGELIALTVDRLGYPAIRGSTDREGMDKGGGAAFREIVRCLKGGGLVAVTPDGPRGPNQVMTPGLPTLLRVAGVKTMLVGFAATPAIQTKGWDLHRIPLPFARAVVVFDGPYGASREDVPDILAAQWGARLNAIQGEAEAMLRT